jgi:hypothetical protein
MVHRVFDISHSLSNSYHGIEGCSNFLPFQNYGNIICYPLDVWKVCLHVGVLIVLWSSPSFILFYNILDVRFSISYALKDLS